MKRTRRQAIATINAKAPPEAPKVLIYGGTGDMPISVARLILSIARGERKPTGQG